MREEYLVLTAIGADRPGIVAALTAMLTERGASVADSRMAILGGEFALIALVTGSADALAALRPELRAVAERLGLELILKETRSPAEHRSGSLRSYNVEVHALDHPGIVHAVTEAVRALGGNVVSLDTAAYQASVTGAPLFRMHLCADFPAEISAARLREALARVSETENADVEVRPA